MQGVPAAPTPCPRGCEEPPPAKVVLCPALAPAPAQLELALPQETLPHSGVWGSRCPEPGCLGSWGRGAAWGRLRTAKTEPPPRCRPCLAPTSALSRLLRHSATSRLMTRLHHLSSFLPPALPAQAPARPNESAAGTSRFIQHHPAGEQRRARARLGQSAAATGQQEGTSQAGWVSRLLTPTVLRPWLLPKDPRSEEHPHTACFPAP